MFAVFGWILFPRRKNGNTFLSTTPGIVVWDRCFVGFLAFVDSDMSSDTPPATPAPSVEAPGSAPSASIEELQAQVQSLRIENKALENKLLDLEEDATSICVYNCSSAVGPWYAGTCSHVVCKTCYVAFNLVEKKDPRYCGKCKQQADFVQIRLFADEHIPPHEIDEQKAAFAPAPVSVPPPLDVHPMRDQPDGDLGTQRRPQVRRLFGVLVCHLPDVNEEGLSLDAICDTIVRPHVLVCTPSKSSIRAALFEGIVDGMFIRNNQPRPHLFRLSDQGTALKAAEAVRRAEGHSR